MKHNNFSAYLGHEDRLQIAVCEYVKLQYPKCVINHSPNEGKRSKFERFKIKALHVSAGFPDLFIVGYGKLLLLELKIDENKALKQRKGKLSINQEMWLRTLTENGITCGVAYGFDEAKKIIDNQFKK